MKCNREKDGGGSSRCWKNNARHFSLFCVVVEILKGKNNIMWCIERERNQHAHVQYISIFAKKPMARFSMHTHSYPQTQYSFTL